MLGWIIFGIIVVFLAIILVRAAMFKPKAQPIITGEDVSFDKDAAISALATLVRCKTVSNVDKSLEDDAVHLFNL